MPRSSRRRAGKIERAEGALGAVREERRESFRRARAAGLFLAEIGDQTKRPLAALSRQPRA